jgi:cytochrome c
MPRSQTTALDETVRRGSLTVQPLIAAAWLVMTGCLALAQDSAAIERRGENLLSNCSRCHAIGRTGASSQQKAPPFRTLGQGYPIDNLAEALAEGFSTIHPDLPEFVFGIRDVAAILAYLQSIQEP